MFIIYFIIVLFFSTNVSAEGHLPNINFKDIYVEHIVETDQVSIPILLDEGWEIEEVIGYKSGTLLYVLSHSNTPVVGKYLNAEDTLQRLEGSEEWKKSWSKSRIGHCMVSIKRGTEECYFFDTQYRKEWEEGR